MFSVADLEYGSYPFEGIVPAGFDWVYPIRCGYGLTDRAGGIGSECAGAVVYLLKGEGMAECGQESAEYLPDCVMVSHSAHQLMLYPQEPTEYLYLYLQNGDPLLKQIGSGCFLLPMGADSRIDRLMWRLCCNIQSKRLDQIYAASADVYALLMELCGQSASAPASYSPLVKQAIAHMRRDYAFLSGMDELADLLGVTKSHLIRSFTTAVGCSPGKYLQSVKLDQARLLLQNRDYSVEMIADMTGYACANYFCKVFRRATGESPGDYRARNAPALDLESKHRLNDLENRYHL